MKLAEKFMDKYGDESIEIECVPIDNIIALAAHEVGDHGMMTVYVEFNAETLGRLNGFLSLCLEAIRRMEELKEQQDG